MKSICAELSSLFTTLYIIMPALLWIRLLLLSHTLSNSPFMTPLSRLSATGLATTLSSSILSRYSTRVLFNQPLYCHYVFYCTVSSSSIRTNHWLASAQYYFVHPTANQMKDSSSHPTLRKSAISDWTPSAPTPTSVPSFPLSLYSC